MKPRSSGRLMCFAGLLSRWIPHNGEAVLSCAILTTSATDGLAAIHERMPVVAPDALHSAWVDRAMTDAAKAAALVDAAAAPDEMERYAVSARVNDARIEGPELLEPLAASEA